ncbi:phosphocarrier protein HPr /dihydroxyacetone kinase DhaM subunit [Herbihabitans rhizosphaerae]|uniref:Phosphocarrier protein HPr n=1 Tax=Herbihabitans rhizosphaerae TaxID=1872711 RepID=A0A4Q7KRK5_9PSEU|nr:dihydroxyacetone kinase phosphoryl donor subunit DhaM [Herbihabitans rhizosphaerae]RZS39107.1 phosphocarrier protein HPr /dihydroxyacetone kinase DhaM subunit [Herbihabitans rhizosphaerae]
MSRVGLVVVSHSARLADGVVEVAAQMAPNVTAVAAGGTADGGIGTDFDAVTAAIENADGGAGVVVLYDLGSARMIAEMAVEAADNARLADGPLVEGAVAAAVAAEGGADPAAVAHAAENAAGPPDEPAPTTGESEEAVVTLTNEIGLHARPAATVARAMTEIDATVTVHFGTATADGRSVLALMGLGARGGDRIRVTATGPRAADAVRTFQELAADNFGD